MLDIKHALAKSMEMLNNDPSQIYAILNIGIVLTKENS